MLSVIVFLAFIFFFVSFRRSLRSTLFPYTTLFRSIYDPALGDPEADIPAGTAFEDLPDDWVCPDCGEPKEEFEAVNE